MPRNVGIPLSALTCPSENEDMISGQMESMGEVYAQSACLPARVDLVPSCWVSGAWEALKPFSGGRIYANYLSVEGEDAVKGAFGKNYLKLVAIKNRYDPTNFFKLNPNIRPRLS